MRNIFLSIFALSSLVVYSTFLFGGPSEILGAVKTITVPQGGTGSTTLSGILSGNGTSPIKTTVIGSGLSWDGTTLSSSGGSSLHATTSANTFVYPQGGRYHSAPYYVATSTTVASTFPYASTTGVSATTLWGSLIGNVTGNVSGTAGSLATNGGNCSAGQFPLGVDSSGAVETCTDAWTEAENTSAGYTTLSGVNGYIHGSTTIPKTYTANTFTGVQTISNASTTHMTIAGTFNMLGDYITNVTTWFLTKLQAVSAFASAASSTWDFGGSASLEIPNGTGPTVDATGETAIDTTANQFLYGTSTAFPAVVMPFQYSRFEVSSSTWTSTTTVNWGGYTQDPLTFISANCYSDAGTVKFSLIDDKLNVSDTVSVSTSTSTPTLFTANNSFTAGEKVQFKLGTPASSPTKVSCSLKYVYDRQ